MKKNEIFNVVLSSVSEQSDVPVEDILSSKKTQEIVDARTIAVHCCKVLGMPTCLIQKMFNKKNAYSINSLSTLYDDRFHQSFFFREVASASKKHIERILKGNTE